MMRATEDRQTNSGTSRHTRPTRRREDAGGRPALLAAGLLLGLALAGCTGPIAQPDTELPGTEVPGTELPGSTQSGASQSGVAAPADTISPADAATVEMKQKVTDALARLAAGTPKPATAQVTDALAGAGVALGVLEVSASRTPTGLEADAVEAAVREGSDCVVGQIRDGNVTVAVLPVLASGKCFVGTGA